MTPEAEQRRQHVLELVRKPNPVVDQNTPLASSGLIDSTALVDLQTKLEDLTQMHTPPGKVQPKDMDTIALRFATAQRVGKPGK
jgi:hypothetical protein